MTATAPEIRLDRLRRVHLVGIGGMHMSAIAAILLARNITVTGSDLSPSRYTDRLKRQGATIYSGHAADNVGAADLVVTTVAARDDNPELAEARRRSIPVVIRAEMVAALMRDLTAVCIAGTHGKTTTSSLLAYSLVTARRSPTYLVGGDVSDLGSNSALGTGREIVIEADEYAGAFLHYTPDLAIVTNIEVDHLDYFKTEAAIVEAFRTFLQQVQPEGLIIACIDSPLLRDLVADRDRNGIKARVETYSLSRLADWTARVDRGGATQRFTVFRRGEQYAACTTLLAGRHNVSNCLGAVAALDFLGVPKPQTARAIAGFHGVRRRFEHIGLRGGVTVMDDYAHHPTEIAATITAAKERFPGKRLVVVFQPHTFSRSAYLLEGFRGCFRGADKLLLLQTYAARETAEAGIDAYALAAEIRTPPPDTAENTDAAVAWLQKNTRIGDLVLTMGAGTVDEVGRALLDAQGRPRELGR